MPLWQAQREPHQTTCVITHSGAAAPERLVLQRHAMSVVVARSTPLHQLPCWQDLAGTCCSAALTSHQPPCNAVSCVCCQVNTPTPAARHCTHRVAPTAVHHTDLEVCCCEWCCSRVEVCGPYRPTLQHKQQQTLCFQLGVMQHGVKAGFDLFSGWVSCSQASDI